MAQDRVEYRVAGAALRAARKRAARVELSALDWRVLTAVMELTASWSKLEDTTSARQITALVYAMPVDDVTGYRRDRVGTSLRRLRDEGVITYRAARTGAGAGITVGLVAPANTEPARGVVSEHGAGARSSPRAGSVEHPPRMGNTEKAEDLSDACEACGGSTWVHAPSGDVVRCPQCWRGAA